MKKFFFVAAATALALSSCSDNEITSVVEKAQNTPISINVYSQSKTRAVTETDIEVLQLNGFKFVALNGTTEMINTTVNYNGGVWSYGETAYWPINESTAVKFYGVYPATNTLDAANDKVTVTVNGTSDAVVAYSSKSLSEATDGSVNLSFSHILGQVTINAMGDNEDFDYNVTGLTLNTDNVIDYTCATKATTAATTSTKTDFTYLATGSSVIANYSSDGIFAPLSLDGQDNTLALPALQVTLTINYTVSSQTAGDLPLQKSATFTPVAGKLNQINLTLPSSRTAMSFTVEVDEWGDEVNTPATWN